MTDPTGFVIILLAEGQDGGIDQGFLGLHHDTLGVESSQHRIK